MTLFIPITRIEFSVAGVPAGRPRPRARAVKTKGGKWIATIYQPKRGKSKHGDWGNAEHWYAAVKAAALNQLPPEPWVGPVQLDVDAYFPRPGRLLKKSSPAGRIPHEGKPDRDNIDKSVMDALKAVGLLKDDSQVCAGRITKWYVAQGCQPGVRIRAIKLSDGWDGREAIVRTIAGELERHAAGARQAGQLASLDPTDMLQIAEQLRSTL